MLQLLQMVRFGAQFLRKPLRSTLACTRRLQLAVERMVLKSWQDLLSSCGTMSGWVNQRLKISGKRCLLQTRVMKWSLVEPRSVLEVTRTRIVMDSLTTTPYLLWESWLSLMIQVWSIDLSKCETHGAPSGTEETGVTLVKDGQTLWESRLIILNQTMANSICHSKTMWIK